MAIRFQKCKVCGKLLRRLTEKHLSKHRLTVQEYEIKFLDPDTKEKEAETPGTAYSEVLTSLQKWMAEGKSLPEISKSLVDNVMRNPEERFKTLLAVQAVASISRTARLMKVIDKAEKKLFSEEVIDNASVGQLLNIMQLASGEQDKINTLISSLSQQKTDPFHDERLAMQMIPGDLEMPENPRQREAVIQVVDRIVQIIFRQRTLPPPPPPPKPVVNKGKGESNGRSNAR